MNFMCGLCEGPKDKNPPNKKKVGILNAVTSAGTFFFLTLNTG